MATVDETIEAPGRGRSPNYPYLNLPTAIEKARKLYGSIGRHPVGVDVAIKAIGHTAKSGSGKKAIGALRAFGLLDDSKAGRDMRVRLSNRALDILTDYREGEPEWCRAVDEAARAPRIHAALLAEYSAGLPPDDELRRYLVRVYDPPFTDAGASDFIAEIRSTLQYANQQKRDLDTLENGNGPETSQREVQVGLFIQWTCAGINRFVTPKKVVGINGEWVFVEGEKTGVNMSEVTVVDAPQPENTRSTPPLNPFYQPTKPEDAPVADGLAKEVTTLSHGPVVLTLPKELDSDGVADLEYWVEGILKKYRRAAGIKPEQSHK